MKGNLPFEFNTKNEIVIDFVEVLDCLQNAPGAVMHEESFNKFSLRFEKGQIIIVGFGEIKEQFLELKIQKEVLTLQVYDLLLSLGLDTYRKVHDYILLNKKIKGVGVKEMSRIRRLFKEYGIE